MVSPAPIPAQHLRPLIYGWIAAKFAGHPGRAIPDFLRRELGLDVSEDMLDRALKGVRGPSVRKKTRGPAGRGARTSPASPQRIISTDWLRVDEDRLGLRKFLIRIPNDGLPLPDVYETLTALPLIRQVIETREDREIVAVALLRPEDDDEDLRARIQEHVPGRSVRVHRILHESDEPTIATWLELAKRQAAG